jgi:hypothetical protein
MSFAQPPFICFCLVASFVPVWLCEPQHTPRFSIDLHCRGVAVRRLPVGLWFAPALLGFG